MTRLRSGLPHEQVIHILFHHAYVPAIAVPERSRMTSIQRILNMQRTRTFSDEHQDYFDAACSGIWETLGDNHLPARDTCLNLLTHLVTVIALFAEYQLVSWQGKAMSIALLIRFGYIRDYHWSLPCV